MRGDSCLKCQKNNWGAWTSASSGKISRYCKTCRKERANTYNNRRRSALGHHTNKEWLEKLNQFNKCPNCKRKWSEIPRRPDKRYKFVWTKDHIIPLNKNGSDKIENIQPLCYQCNFGKR